MVEAQLSGYKNTFDCPIRLSIWGHSEPALRDNLEARLKADKILKANELKESRKGNELQRSLQRAADGVGGSQRQPTSLRNNGPRSGFATSNLADEPQISMEDLLKASQTLCARPGEDIAKTLAMDEEQLSQMPLAAQPEALVAQLLPYQLQGLAWMQAKESPTFPEPGSTDAVQLWKRNIKGDYVNIATSITVKKAPRLLSGGILADDMGLGKTLQTISLILTGGPGKTLIVAPLSVMSNWRQQIETHVHVEGLPKVLIYHGPKRFDDAKSIDGYDVVITSYPTLMADWGENKRGPLIATKWRRLVLDEGHTIRNPKTRVAQAACAIEAESRWVLTGTPM